jgi:hypothetical protein
VSRIGHTRDGGLDLRRTTLAFLAGAALGIPATAADVPGSGIEPALSADFGSPLWLSASLGIRIPLGGPGTARGLLVQVQPGVGGGALNVGFVPVSFRAQGVQAIGVGVKARLLRTWGTPWGTEPGVTYAGFEAGAAMGVKLAAGLLWKVGSGSGDDRVWTWSVGLGL